MTIGEQIKELREKNNVSQEQLADAVDVSRQTVSRWENNENYPGVKKIRKMTLFFKLPENYFFRKEEKHSDSATFGDGGNFTFADLKKDETAVADSDCPPPNAPSVTPESESNSPKNSKKKIVIASIVLILALLSVFFVILADRLRYLEVKRLKEEGITLLETFTVSMIDVPQLIVFLVGVVLVVVCGGVLIWHFIKRKKEKKNHEKKK